MPKPFGVQRVAAKDNFVVGMAEDTISAGGWRQSLAISAGGCNLEPVDKSGDYP